MSPFEFVIALVALAMIYKLILVALQRRGCGRGVRPSPEDEYEIMRDIQTGLSRMDQRIEALETLLADQNHAQKTTATDARTQ